MLFKYYITFRVADETVDGRTREERRRSVMENANEGKGFWAEMSDFILTQSPQTTWPFAKHVTSGLSPEHDTAVIFDPSDMSAAYFGPVEELEALESFFRVLRKVT